MSDYNWRVFRKVFLILVFVIAGMSAFNYISDKYDFRNDIKSKTYEDWQMGAFLNSRDKVCQSTELGFDVRVELESEEYTLGQWLPSNNTIYLDQTDIDTVAHEVYHMTQTMMRRYDIKEEELGAFMQGSFTSCVYELIRLKYESSI